MENTMIEETVGQIMRRKREEMGLGIRELCRMSEKNPAAGRKFTSGWYSRIEMDDPTVKMERVSMDFFWAVGVLLGIDPLKLFVMSRPDIPQKFAEKKERDKIFKLG